MLASLVLLIQLPTVQTFLTQKVANYLSKELNTRVSVDAVDIDFFNYLVLEGFYIEDLKGDTLIYTHKLAANFSSIDYKNKKLNVGDINLEGAIVALKVYEGDTSNNMKFLMKYFVRKDSSSAKSWLIDFNTLKIYSSAFSFHNFNRQETEFGIDFYHLNAKNINGEFTETSFISETLYTNIQNLSLEEISGFKLNNLTAEAKISPKKTSFQNLIVKTPTSDIFTDLSFEMEKYSDYQNFIEEVIMESRFSESLLHLKDLAYFVPQFQHLNNSLKISGKVFGTVGNLSGTDVELFFLDESYFSGDFDVRGLPDFEDSFMHLKVNELSTTASDMNQLPIPPFENNQYFQSPENFNKLGKIFFKGSFTGFYNNFVAFGSFSTQLGTMNTDLSLKQEDGIFSYSGNISSLGFDVGRFMDIKDLSTISMNVKVNGEGLNKEDIKLAIDGKINKLKFKDYIYKKIKASGLISKNRFTGNVVANDPNLVLDFNGTVDVSGSKPITNFKASIDKALLANLNLFHTKDSATNISFYAEFNSVGKSIDEIEGEIKVTDINYVDSKRDYKFENIQLTALQDVQHKKLKLESGLFDMEVEGNYNIKELGASLKEFANIYLPSVQYEIENNIENQLVFEVHLKNTHPLSDIFLPELHIDSGAIVKGSFSTIDENLVLSGLIPHFKYASFGFDNVEVSGDNSEDSLNLNIDINQLNFLDSPALKSVQVNFSSFYNTLLTSIKWDNESRKVNNAAINVETAFNGFENFSMAFFDTYLAIADSTWNIREDNEIQYFNGNLNFYNFELYSGNQKLKLDGGISKDSSTQLLANIENFNLQYMSGFIPNNAIELSGVVDGEMKLNNFYTSPITVFDVEFKDLMVNNIVVGESRVISSWNSNTKALNLDASFGELQSDILRASGNIYPYNVENSLDLEVEVNELPLEMMDRYIDDYLSNISGTANGNLSIGGNFKKPILNGEFDLDSARMKVNYLNTYYTLNDGVFVDNDLIGFNFIKLVDDNGNIAIATGSIFHDNYTDFNLDIGLDVENFMALNTKAKDNDLFYGKAIVSGLANITGFADQLIFDINVTTNKGTRFFIPLDRGSEVSNNNFLTFTNSTSTKKLEENYKVDLTGIQLNFDLQVTPDAMVSLVFDEQIGDIMKARGEGNLKLEINTLGKFNMFGQYVIQDGDYLFTLQNLINKKFEMEKGGRLSWKGDPYDANIDVSAIYKLRASLYDILVDTTGTYRRRIPVDLKLMMSGKLLNPEIEFDINVPTADDQAKQALQSILYVNSTEVNRQEMNQQVFGLLVLNRFLPPSGTGQVNEEYERSNIGSQNYSEILSNQLSNWLSRLSDDVDIGIRYRPGDELSSDELEVELSTEILDDRILLDGNFGYSNNDYNINNQNNSGLIGEFSIEYKMSADGRFRIRGFNRSNNNSLLRINSPYTQGFGIFYREEFDHLSELWRKWWNKSSIKEEEEESFIP